MNLPERFSAKIKIVDDCWIWTAAHQVNGYGIFRFEGRNVSAHRFSFLMSGQIIPEGKELDHLCRNRACVNPAHLEPVTRKENLRRSPISRSAKCNRMTHCARGHERNDQNTYTRMNKGYIQRICRLCHVIADKKYRRT